MTSPMPHRIRRRAASGWVSVTDDLSELAASGEFDVVEGPARRFGARGDGTSLYVRDPDGLVVELRHYG